MPTTTPAPEDPLEASAKALEADNAALQADIAELPTLDKPRRRRNSDSDSNADDGPDEFHPSRLPAQWEHPLGPWGDTPAQSRY